MHQPLRVMPVLSLLINLLAAIPLSTALKFDLPSHPQSQHKKSERCIRNFVARDTLVIVTAIVSGSRGDGQTVNMHVSRTMMTGLKTPWADGRNRDHQIKDAVGNEYGRPKDVAGEQRMAFTALADAAFDVCFENHLTTRTSL